MAAWAASIFAGRRAPGGESAHRRQHVKARRVRPSERARRRPDHRVRSRRRRTRPAPAPPWNPAENTDRRSSSARSAPEEQPGRPLEDRPQPALAQPGGPTCRCPAGRDAGPIAATARRLSSVRAIAAPPSSRASGVPSSSCPDTGQRRTGSPRSDRTRPPAAGGPLSSSNATDGTARSAESSRSAPPGSGSGSSASTCSPPTSLARRGWRRTPYVRAGAGDTGDDRTGLEQARSRLSRTKAHAGRRGGRQHARRASTPASLGESHDPGERADDVDLGSDNGSSADDHMPSKCSAARVRHLEGQPGCPLRPGPTALSSRAEASTSKRMASRRRGRAGRWRARAGWCGMRSPGCAAAGTPTRSRSSPPQVRSNDLRALQSRVEGRAGRIAVAAFSPSGWGNSHPKVRTAEPAHLGHSSPTTSSSPHRTAGASPAGADRPAKPGVPFGLIWSVDGRSSAPDRKWSSALVELAELLQRRTNVLQHLVLRPGDPAHRRRCVPAGSSCLLGEHLERRPCAAPGLFQPVRAQNVMLELLHVFFGRAAHGLEAAPSISGTIEEHLVVVPSSRIGENISVR